MSKFDFILDTMKYSYSSVNIYETCGKCFYLTYIEIEDRASNFFADFGLLCHQVLQEYFEGKIEISDMPKFYEDNYGKFIVSQCPSYPAGMEQNYYDSGLGFFQNFQFDKSLYDVIMIEKSIDAEYHGISLSVKPDLILKEKSTGNHILVDYKTSKIKKSKKDKQRQLEDYLRQFYLYVQFLWLEKNIEIKKIIIWYIRDNVQQEIIVDPLCVLNVLEWFENTIEKIKNEEIWPNNEDPSNRYFCDQICSMRLVQGSCRVPS